MSKDVIETAVEIMGRTYHVKCLPSEISELQQAAQYLENKLNEVRQGSQSVGFDRIAVIVALNITHELLASRQQKNESTERLNQKLRHLKNKIDEALIRYTQMELEPATKV